MKIEMVNRKASRLRIGGMLAMLLELRTPRS